MKTKKENKRKWRKETEDKEVENKKWEKKENKTKKKGKKNNKKLISKWRKSVKNKGE